MPFVYQIFPELEDWKDENGNIKVSSLGQAQRSELHNFDVSLNSDIIPLVFRCKLLTYNTLFLFIYITAPVKYLTEFYHFLDIPSKESSFLLVHQYKCRLKEQSMR